MKEATTATARAKRPSSWRELSSFHHQTTTIPFSSYGSVKQEVWPMTRVWFDATVSIMNGVLLYDLMSSFQGSVRSLSALVVRSSERQLLGVLLVYGFMVALGCVFAETRAGNIRNKSLSREIGHVFFAISVVSAVFALSLHLVAPNFLGRWALLLFLANTGALLTARAIRRPIQRRLAKTTYRNVVIVGAGRVGRTLAHHFEKNAQLGFVVCGFIDEKPQTSRDVLGCVDELVQITRAHFVDEVFITIPSERELVKSIIIAAREHKFNVHVVPELFDGLAAHAPVQYFGGIPAMALHSEPIPAVGLFIKRLLDIVGGLLALAITSPLIAIIATLIRLDSAGPFLYRSIRVGKKGKRFECLKFRSMVSNADALKSELQHLNFREGPTFKIASDPRVTRVGDFLRRYSLDELPQLWNVVAGDMSLVGPRPHPLDDFAKYHIEHYRRLDVKPGVTGLWQITARQDPSFETNLRLDMQYIENWSLSLDLKILLLTLPTVLKGMGQ